MKTFLIQDHSSDSLLRQCLVNRGHEVVVCHGAKAGQDAWTRERVPLVVLDVKREEEIFGFCRWIANQPIRSRTFVVAAIPITRGDRADEILKAGADDVVLQEGGLPPLNAGLASVERQVRQRTEWLANVDASNTRAQQQVAIAALGQCAFSQDLSVLMDLTNEFVMRLLGVEFCATLELSNDGGALTFLSGFGWHPGEVLDPPPPDSLTGRTLRGEPFVVDDLAADARFSSGDFLAERGVVSAVSVPIRGEERQVFGVLGAYAATRRTFVEDELRFVEGLANVLGTAMERRMREAEIQKHQAQVQHLQRLESVGQLAAGLAHDYNNVLTIIHGHVTLSLADPALPPGISASLKTVLEAVERAAELTRHMLSFSRKHPLELKPVDLNNVVNGVAKLLDRILGANIELRTDAEKDLSLIRADTGMLDQVLLNLAVNARDAMPSGGKLVISTSRATIPPGQANQHPEAREGDFVCLAVSDTGCGMDDAIIRQIFDPFFTTKEPGKGTGLGLSTVYGIVKQHEGWIVVDSQRGHGTTFRIYFPAWESAPVPAEMTAPSVPSTAPLKILLVEDEPNLRQLARLLLEDLGYGVMEAGSGAEALQVWANHQEAIQILFTDLVLPDGLTGFELAERLIRERPRLGVVLTSGYGAESVGRGQPGLDRIVFLKKPYGTEMLQRAIQRSLTGPPANLQREQVPSPPALKA